MTSFLIFCCLITRLDDPQQVPDERINNKSGTEVGLRGVTGRYLMKGSWCDTDGGRNKGSKGEKKKRNTEEEEMGAGRCLAWRKKTVWTRARWNQTLREARRRSEVWLGKFKEGGGYEGRRGRGGDCLNLMAERSYLL